MKKVKKVYNRFYNKITDKAANYALDKFVNSDYARQNINVIPLMITSTILRTMFNFLITSRLVTGIFWVDFSVGVFVTVALTVLTPFFYNMMRYQENEFLQFTNLVVNNLWDEDGWDFFYKWKVRILGGTGLFLIFILFFVEITSEYAQEIIFHSLIAGYISDKITENIEKLLRKKVEKTRREIVKPAKGKFIKMTYETEDSGEEIELDSSYMVINEYNPNKAKKE